MSNPSTLTGASWSTVDTRKRIRPLVSSSGDVYGISIDSGGRPSAWKATDPTVSWSQVGTSGRPTHATVAELDYDQLGDVIYVVTAVDQNATIKFHKFDMSSDTWTTIDETVTTTAFTGAANFPKVGIAVRSTGEAVVIYDGPTYTVMGTTYQQVVYRRRTGVATWTAATKISDGDALSTFAWNATTGASDRVHFIYNVGTSNEEWVKTLSAANVLQTDPAGRIVAGNSFSFDAIGGGVHVPDLGDIRWPGNYGASAIPHCFHDTSGDSITGDVPGEDVSSEIGTLPAVAYWGSDVYMLWIHVPGVGASRLRYAVSTGGGTTWGSAVEDFNYANAIRGASIFWRAGNTKRVLALFGSTNSYYEIVLETAAAAGGGWSVGRIRIA